MNSLLLLIKSFTVYNHTENALRLGIYPTGDFSSIEQVELFASHCDSEVVCFAIKNGYDTGLFELTCNNHGILLCMLSRKIKETRPTCKSLNKCIEKGWFRTFRYIVENTVIPEKKKKELLCKASELGLYKMTKYILYKTGYTQEALKEAITLAIEYNHLKIFKLLSYYVTDVEFVRDEVAKRGLYRILKMTGSDIEDHEELTLTNLLHNELIEMTLVYILGKKKDILSHIIVILRKLDYDESYINAFICSNNKEKYRREWMKVLN